MPPHPKNQITAVVLDLGGVVLKLDWVSAIETLGLKGSPYETYFRGIANMPVYDRFERGVITPEEFFCLMKNDVPLLTSFDHFVRGWNRLIAGTVDGVDAVIESVKQPLFALSNTNATHIHHCLDMFPVFQRFRNIFTSYEFGARKPERLIFKRLLDKLGVGTSEILFVDDLAQNVEAARAMGIHAEACCHSAQDLASIFRAYGIIA